MLYQCYISFCTPASPTSHPTLCTSTIYGVSPVLYIYTFRFTALTVSKSPFYNALTYRLLCRRKTVVWQRPTLSLVITVSRICPNMKRKNGTLVCCRPPRFLCRYVTCSFRLPYMFSPNPPTLPHVSKCVIPVPYVPPTLFQLSTSCHALQTKVETQNLASHKQACAVD